MAYIKSAYKKVVWSNPRRKSYMCANDSTIPLQQGKLINFGSAYTYKRRRLSHKQHFPSEFLHRRKKTFIARLTKFTINFFRVYRISRTHTSPPFFRTYILNRYKNKACTCYIRLVRSFCGSLFAVWKKLFLF